MFLNFWWEDETIFHNEQSFPTFSKLQLKDRCHFYFVYTKPPSLSRLLQQGYSKTLSSLNQLSPSVEWISSVNDKRSASISILWDIFQFLLSYKSETYPEYQIYCLSVYPIQLVVWPGVSLTDTCQRGNKLGETTSMSRSHVIHINSTNTHLHFRVIPFLSGRNCGNWTSLLPNSRLRLAGFLSSSGDGWRYGDRASFFDRGDTVWALV